MIYTGILQNTSVIADYSDEMGDFPQMLKKIYNSNRQRNEFYVVPYLNYDYYFLHSKSYTFATIANSNEDNTKILVFLQKLRDGYFDLVNKKEKDGLMLKTITLIRNCMKEYKGNNENKFKKVENKLEDIIAEKHNQLEATLEKDGLINKIKEKSHNLKDEVR